MIYIAIPFLSLIIVHGLIIRFMVIKSREDKRELEDRIMTLTDPNALLSYKAFSDPEPGTVVYLDDEKREKDGA